LLAFMRRFVAASGNFIGGACTLIFTAAETFVAPWLSVATAVSA